MDPAIITKERWNVDTEEMTALKDKIFRWVLVVWSDNTKKNMYHCCKTTNNTNVRINS